MKKPEYKMKKCYFPITIAALLAIFFSSCSNTCKMANKNTLTSHPWQLNTLNGSALVAGDFPNEVPFLLFESNGKLSGSTGCNTMSGNYTLKKACLELNPGAMTRMACPGNGETLVLDALSKVKNIKINRDTLTLFDGSKELMTLIPKK
jgi:heat shock protein HslJ